MTKKKRLYIVISVVLVVAVIGGGFFAYIKLHKQTPQTATQTTTNTKTGSKNAEPTTQTIRLIAVGDQLPHDSVNQNAKQADGTYNYMPFFSEVKPFFDKADIHFCNQEVTSAGASFGISGYPVFNAPTQFAKDLSTLGCDVINRANNHAFDKGQAGINATLDAWDGLQKKAIAGSNRSQAEQDTIRYFTVKGVKFAFLAYAEYSNIATTNPYAVNIYSADLATRQLAEARKNADVVLVSMHWGTEYSPTENAMQKNAATLLANNGADIVIGTGPHVLEPVARLPKAGGGETLVWYSLGNFLNTQLDIESLIGGIAVMDFTVPKDGGKPTLDKVGFLPTYMHYEWTPAQKAAEDLLSRKNLKIYPLDKAAEAMARSQNNTTPEAQQERVKAILNAHTPVTMLTSSTY